MSVPSPFASWQGRITPWRATHRHKKGGLYRVLGEGVNEANRSETLVIYDDETGQIWVRPSVEFWDGRFAELPKPKPSMAQRLRAFLS